MLRLIAAAAVLSLAAFAAAAQTPVRTISVSGVGDVAAAPDMAILSLGAQSEAGTAAEALARTSEAVAAALGVLEDAGIAARDIQTSGLNLSPRWTHTGDGSTPPRITGYVASNQVTVRVRDLDSLGGLLDTVVSEGANTFNGLSFALQEPRATEDAARRAAVADARARAELFAEAAGVALGPVQTIDEEGGAQPMPMFRMEAAMADAGVPVAPGELTVSARVRVVFAIAD